jgi:hypothetical protein
VHWRALGATNPAVAGHEFLPQTVLSSQLERNSASATGTAATRGTTFSGMLTSSWKLRSGTQLALTEARQSSPGAHRTSVLLPEDLRAGTY